MNRTFTLAREVAERKIRGEHLLIPISHSDEDLSALYNLPNETASLIWEEAKAGQSEEKIIARILQEFDTDQATAQTDVNTLLNELIKRQLLQETPA